MSAIIYQFQPMAELPNRIREWRKARGLTLDAVLDLFQSEDVHDGDVLRQYVEDYPQYAIQLIDFSRLLAAPELEDESPLSATDESRIDAAWIMHKAASPGEPAGEDPLARLTPHSPSKSLISLS